MVALKPNKVSKNRAEKRSSRNAVVALKLRQVPRLHERDQAKQERRGGIETCELILHPLGREGQSRNAVVALKRRR